MAKDEIPGWIQDEIRSAEFEEPEQMTRTGYILDIFDEDNKIDAQFYDPVADGRHIITLDVPGEIGTGTLEKGVVYEFKLDSCMAPLSEKAAQFLKVEKGIEMNAIYQFTLRDAALLEQDSG